MRWGSTVKEIYNERMGKARRRHPRGKDDTRHAEMMKMVDQLGVEQLLDIKIPDDWTKTTTDDAAPLNPPTV